jgi:hypothetical protein
MPGMDGRTHSTRHPDAHFLRVPVYPLVKLVYPNNCYRVYHCSPAWLVRISSVLRDLTSGSAWVAEGGAQKRAADLT